MATRDDKKKLIGEYLKAADRFIQASEFTDAMAEVKKALALEPGNMYALAYNQRIKSALESQRKKEDAARVKKIAESAKSASSPRKDEAATVPAPETEQPSAPPSPDVPAAASEDDRYLIKQQQAQIERFKKEVESLRLKHQQEIAMLAEELRQSKETGTGTNEKIEALAGDLRRAKEAEALAQEKNQSLNEELKRLKETNQSLAEDLRRAKEAETQSQERNQSLAEDLNRVKEANQSVAEELRRSNEAEKAAKEKYQALVDDAEESHRRVEELYAEVKRLQDEREHAAAVSSSFDAVTPESLLREVVSHLLLADTLSAEANDVMELIRSKLGFSDDAFVQLQTSVKFDLYKSALEKAWTEGYITPEQAERLSELRKKIGVSAEDHFRLEAELRSAKKKR